MVGLSARIKDRGKQVAEQSGRPWCYVESPRVSKEDIARRIMGQDGIEDGLICVLSCVEPCQTFVIRKDRATPHIHLVPAKRKCSYLYFYPVDREFGFMHIRLQTTNDRLTATALSAPRENTRLRSPQPGQRAPPEGGFIHAARTGTSHSILTDLQTDLRYINSIDVARQSTTNTRGAQVAQNRHLRSCTFWGCFI